MKSTSKRPRITISTDQDKILHKTFFLSFLRFLIRENPPNPWLPLKLILELLRPRIRIHIAVIN
jgi:hypothetical protein